MTKHYITDDALKGIEKNLPLVEIPVSVVMEPHDETPICIATDARGMAMILTGLLKAGGRFRTLGQAIAEQFDIKYGK